MTPHYCDRPAHCRPREGGYPNVPKSVQCVGEKQTTCVSRTPEEGEVGLISVVERYDCESSMNGLHLTV